MTLRGRGSSGKGCSGWLSMSGALARARAQSQGLQSHGDGPAFGLHERGRGPGDRFSLPYFRVADMSAALERVVELGGDVVHPGERWAICRDSEGSPFGLAGQDETLEPG